MVSRTCITKLYYSVRCIFQPINGTITKCHTVQPLQSHRLGDHTAELQSDGVDAA
jgi:hypothetical protein